MPRTSTYRRVLSFGVPSESLTRDIWLICLSNVIGAFGEGLYFWVFPIYVRSLQADYVQLGLVLSALSGVSALAPLPGGFLADRFDRKKILIIAWIPWVLAPLIYSFAENWILLIPGTVCWGVSMIGVPAANAYIITAVEDKRKLASVFSFVWSSYSFSYIFAPTVGGYLATIIGMRSIFYIATLLTAAATGVFLFLHSQHPPKQTIDAQRPLTLSNDTRRHWRSVLVWSAFFAFTAFFVSVGRAFIPTFLNEEIKLSEFYVGLFGSVNFAGITFIGIAMGRLGDRWRKSGAIGVCLFLYGMAVLPLMLIREPVVLMFDAFLLGSFAAISTLVGSHVGSIAPENKRGLWTSIPLTMSLLAGFAAPFLTGYLYTLSPYYGFIVSIGAMPLLIFFALTKLKA